jgi:hypothetical protein
MADTINGVERYAQNFVIATDSGSDNVMGEQSVFCNFPNTGGATVDFAFSAPKKGTLKFAYVQGSITSDATKTYTITAVNISNSSAAMLGTNLYDADPVLTAGTRASMVLSATAANLDVDEGDLVVVTVVGGAGAGDASVEMVFEYDG